MIDRSDYICSYSPFFSPFHSEGEKKTALRSSKLTGHENVQSSEDGSEALQAGKP